MLVGMKMAMLDALAQELEQPLKQKPGEHTQARRRGSSKRLRHQVQEAHGDDEGAAKRQNETEVVDASLAHQHEKTSSEECGRQKQRGGQQHAVRG